MKYETVIGLEVHVELATNSKIFCSCSAHSFGADPNSHVCPACCGMPGMLPVMNKRVVELAATAGLMLNCEISRYTTFDKKNYYYPDLPCAYQITQLNHPICTNGLVPVKTKCESKDQYLTRPDLGRCFDAEELIRTGRMGVCSGTNSDSKIVCGHSSSSDGIRGNDGAVIAGRDEKSVCFCSGAL